MEKFPPQQKPSAFLQDCSSEAFGRFTNELTDPNSFIRSHISDFFSSVSLITPDYSGVFSQRNWTCQDTTLSLCGGILT